MHWYPRHGTLARLLWLIVCDSCRWDKRQKRSDEERSRRWRRNARWCLLQGTWRRGHKTRMQCLIVFFIVVVVADNDFDDAHWTLPRRSRPSDIECVRVASTSRYRNLENDRVQTTPKSEFPKGGVETFLGTQRPGRGTNRWCIEKSESAIAISFLSRTFAGSYSCYERNTEKFRQIKSQIWTILVPEKNDCLVCSRNTDLNQKHICELSPSTLSVISEDFITYLRYKVPATVTDNARSARYSIKIQDAIRRNLHSRHAPWAR